MVSMEENFLAVADKHVPLKFKRIRNKKSPWLTPAVKKQLIRRDQLKKIAIKSSTVENWNNYKKLQNTCTN